MKKIVVFFLLVFFIFSNISISYSNENIPYERRIVINIPSRTLTLVHNDLVEKIYPVAVGKSNTQTPFGNYYVMNKAKNPYYSRKKIPGGRPNNPLGIRWIGFKNRYGIHGNSKPSSIGTIASGGCVRMFNYDVKELYENVNVHTKVDIVYNIFDTIYPNIQSLKVLVIYPDVYNKEKNLEGAILKRLEQENINNIGNEKIKAAVQSEKKKTKVIAKQWAVIVNDHYITTDTYKDEVGVYVSEEFLKNYFGLFIEDLGDGNLSIRGIPVHYQSFDEGTYVLLKSIHEILGGTLSINNALENIWYDVSFVKLNGVFLEVNNSKIATHKPLIPINQLSKVLGKESINKNVIKIKNVPYMGIENAQEFFQFEYDYHSIDKKIELYASSVIEMGNREINDKKRMK